MPNLLTRSIMRGVSHRLMQFGEEYAGNFTLKPVPGKQYLLYVHIPYCEFLCPYCSFHRVPYQSQKASLYFKALRDEIRHYSDLGFEFGEVYIGGGTPTVDLPELTSTLDLIRQLFRVTDISVETNPDHLHQETFDALLNHGVTRLSVGVQSFDDQLLKRMGRYDHYGSGAEIAQRLKDTEGQFNTLNVDMIFNLPGQDQAKLARDINTLLEIDVGQVSFYPLMMADSTRSRVQKEMGDFSYSREKAMYYQVLDSMSPSHPPSSAWCFSRGNNQIDEYLVTHQEFVGVGSGSLSYLNGSLYASSFSIMQYDQLLETQKTGITRIRPLNEREQYFYRMLMSLFGLSLEPSMSGSKTAQILRLAGIVDGTTPTRKGMYYVVMAMSEFLSGVNNFRDDMRRSLTQEYDASYGIQPVNLIQLD